MVNLDAGELCKRISIQSVTKISDNEGGFTDSWATFTTVWASIKPMRPKQVAEYKSSNVHATHIVKVRGGVDIEEGHRILFGVRVFEVKTVENEMEAGVAKWVICKERRA